MTSLYNFNPGRKSWRVFASEITTINNDDLTIKVENDEKINFIQGGNTYNISDFLNTNTDSILNNNLDASFCNLDISGDLNVNGNFYKNGESIGIPKELESSIQYYIPLTENDNNVNKSLYDLFIDMSNEIQNLKTRLSALEN